MSLKIPTDAIQTKPTNILIMGQGGNKKTKKYLN